MGNQGWIVFVFLGISAISWVFGKMKEKAEAEQAQQRARLHQERLQRLAEEAGDAQPTERQVPAQAQAQASKQQQLIARKQQLAQLRKERLAALRAEMAAKQQAKQSQARQAPARAAQRRQAPIAPPQQPPAPTRPSRTVQRQANKPMPSATAAQRASRASADQQRRAVLSSQRPHPQRGTDHETVHRLVADAESTAVTRRPKRHSAVGNFSREDWRQAIILSELLAPPVSLRRES